MIGMRRNICLLTVLFAICSSLIALPKESFAAEQSVTVTLPGFEVTLNGNKVENQYREYPLLTYKDITYFPMTWYDCRLLGLVTEWTPEEGLAIAEGNVASSYVPYTTDRKNANSYKATVPTFGITVNGKTIDNSKEQYPLLIFRDVTYFPLTWRFAHDEFGWEYAWDNANGLTIASGNPQIKTVNLPASAGDNHVAVFKGYYYFTETTGNTNQVYRAPVDNASNKELVYSYEGETPYGFSKHVQFEIMDNELWFFYHIGGATMGSNVYCKVNDDGKAVVVHRGYLDFTNTPYGTLITNLSVPPHGDNLLLVPAGQEDASGNRVGNPDLIYGRHATIDETSIGYGGGSSAIIIGDDAYVLASPYPLKKGDLNKIYKINLKMNTTEKVIDSAVNSFNIVNNKLYYVKDEDHFLYSANLDGTNEQKLSDSKVANWYDEVGGNVYYTVAIAEGQFNLYKVEPLGEDALVLKEPVESVQRANDKIICKLAAGEDYGVKVVNKSGDLDLAIADQVSDVFAYDDQLLIVSAEDKSIKLVK